MLKESISFMMLLITASIVVTVSAYEPQRVGTQPQPQPLQPQPQPQTQTQKQPLQGSQILGRAQPPAGTDIVTNELQQNAQLADRLFPFIVQKLDGNTLVQKLDSVSMWKLMNKLDGRQLAYLLVQKMDGQQLAALLQKADGRLLTEKMLPYLSAKVTVIDRNSPTHTVTVKGLTGGEQVAPLAVCAPGETAVSGGFVHQTGLADEPNLEQFTRARDHNGWQLISTVETSGKIWAQVSCLKVELGLQEPQEQRSPPPPAGPPLQPPPGFGK